MSAPEKISATPLYAAVGMFALWYCLDDRIAAFLERPELGARPYWLSAIGFTMLAFSFHWMARSAWWLFVGLWLLITGIWLGRAGV